MNHEIRPVHILSGFLGTGKTTLLNRLLERPDFANTLVIVNEFGEIPLDHHLITSSSETIVELSNGCLCCSIRGELVETLLSLDTTRFERIIIETTGIADPLPVHQALTVQPVLARGMRAGSILTVFDAGRGADLIQQHEEAAHQLVLADIVYLSMSDLAGDVPGAKNTIADHNPVARVIQDPSEISTDLLDAQGGTTKTASGSGHSGTYSSVVLQCEEPQPVAAVIGFLDQLSGLCGQSLLRLKGFVRTFETNDCPLLVQMSGPIVHEPIKLDDWPVGLNQTQLVVITKDIDSKIVRATFNSFFGIADIDTPDRNAITENPLAVPGM